MSYKIPKCFDVEAEKTNAETIAAIEDGRKLAYDNNAVGYTDIDKLKAALDEPNEVTLAAIAEGEQMLNDPNSPRFSSVEELFAELNS